MSRYDDPPPTDRPPDDQVHALTLSVPLTRADAHNLVFLIFTGIGERGEATPGPRLLCDILAEVAWEVAEGKWREMLTQEGWQ